MCFIHHHSPARAAAVDVQATDANIVVQIVQPVHHRQGGVAAAVAGVKRLRHLDIATGLGLVARVPEHQSPVVTNFTGNKGVTIRRNSENQPHQNKTLVKIKIQAWVNHEHVCS